MSKEQIREEMLRKRSLFSEKELQKKNLQIAKNFFLLKEVSDANFFGVYVSFQNEVETRGIIGRILKFHKKVCVPITDFKNKEMHFSELNNISDLHENSFGMLEPMNSKKVDPKKIDVFVVPGVAFDSQGNRIGLGKGFYDKFFNNTKTNAKKIALAFDFQIVKKIPVEKFDVKMDLVVTEKEII